MAPFSFSGITICARASATLHSRFMGEHMSDEPRFSRIAKQQPVEPAAYLERIGHELAAISGYTKGLTVLSAIADLAEALGSTTHAWEPLLREVAKLVQDRNAHRTGRDEALRQLADADRDRHALRAKLDTESRQNASKSVELCTAYEALRLAKQRIAALEAEQSPHGVPACPSWICDAYEATGLKVQGGTWTDLLQRIRLQRERLAEVEKLAAERGDLIGKYREAVNGASSYAGTVQRVLARVTGPVPA